jgi:hypothetical protein
LWKLGALQSRRRESGLIQAHAVATMETPEKGKGEGKVEMKGKRKEKKKEFLI